MALGAYLASYPSGVGARYLFLYGALQALAVQQDAVRHLGEAMGGNITGLDDPRLREARRIRIGVAGHPTKRDRPKGSLVTTHQVARITLGPGGFMMLRADEQGKIETEDIDMPKLIKDQREAVAEILETLDGKLDREDRARRVAHKDQRLSRLFPDSLGYSFEKLFEGVRRDHPLGRVSLDHMKQVIAAFAQALDERGLSVDAYPGVKDWYAEIKHPIAELEAVVEGRSNLHPETASIVVWFLQKQMKLLRKMAEEIDEDWRVDDSAQE